MQFEQFQEEDGKNIINITVRKNNGEVETPKQNIGNIINITVGKNDSIMQEENPENFINHNIPYNTGEQRQDIPTHIVYNSPINHSEENQYLEYTDEKYKMYQYYLLGGIFFALIFLIVLVILYKQGV